jgi:hypothetical protein
VKVITQAVEALEKLALDAPARQVLDMLKAAQKKSEGLEYALDECLKQIEDTRYRDWPKGTSDALGLRAERMDELIHTGHSALEASRRGARKKK